MRRASAWPRRSSTVTSRTTAASRSRSTGRATTATSTPTRRPGCRCSSVPSVALLQPRAARVVAERRLHALWGVRVLSVGIAFLLCAFLVGRVIEGLAPGFGGAALVTLRARDALGAARDDELRARSLGGLARIRGVPARVAASDRRSPGSSPAPRSSSSTRRPDDRDPSRALRRARRAARALVALPRRDASRASSLLGAYDWAAFGAPWHLSYRYVDNVDAGFQASGLLRHRHPAPLRPRRRVRRATAGSSSSRPSSSPRRTASSCLGRDHPRRGARLRERPPSCSCSRTAATSSPTAASRPGRASSSPRSRSSRSGSGPRSAPARS